MYCVAQVPNPVKRIGGLSSAQGLTVLIGDDGQPGRAQPDAAQVGLETAQDGFEHARMGRNVDLHALWLHIPRTQQGFQTVQRILGPRDHTEFGRVHAGHVQRWLHQGTHFCRRQRHAEHAARRNGVEQPTAQQHESDAVLERHHASQAGSRVLTHAVAHQRCWLDTPRHPQLRQRVFHDHDQRQLHRRSLEFLHRFGMLLRVGQPHRADVVIQLLLQQVQTLIHPVLEHRFGGVKLPGHARVLRTTTREHEHHLRIVA